MVILPLFFQLCHFTPAFSNRRETLPLFYEMHLAVLKLVQNDKFVLANLPLLLSVLYDFTPVLSKKSILTYCACAPQHTIEGAALACLRLVVVKKSKLL
jgi:hypothetical protein